MSEAVATRSAQIVAGYADRRIARARASENLPAPRLDLAGAPPRQRAALCAIMDDLAAAEGRQAAGDRRWRRWPDAGALPPGVRPVCALRPLSGGGRPVRLGCDPAGRLVEIAEGGAEARPVTIRDAIAAASGDG